MKLLMVKDPSEYREVLTLIPWRTVSQVEQEKKEKAEPKGGKPEEGNMDSGSLADEVIEEEVELEL